MGNLAIISDLHVDINQFSEQEWLILWKVLTDKGITRLHLAGDVANKVDLCQAVVEFFAKKEFLQRSTLGTMNWPMLREKK